MSNKGAETLGCILGAVIFFALWMAFSNATSSDPCIKKDCNVHRAAGSQYCEFHRQYFDAEYIKDHPLPTRAARESSSYSYTAEPTRRSTPTPTPRPASRTTNSSRTTSSSSRTTSSSRTYTSSYTERDVDDYDVDGFYYDNRGDFENEDDAWDYLEDEPDDWD